MASLEIRLKVDDMEMDEVVDRNYSHEEIKDLEQKYFELEADNKRISNELANEFSKVRDAYRVRFDESKSRVKQSEEMLEALRTENKKIRNENNNLKAQLEDLSSLRTENKKDKKIILVKLVTSKFSSKIYQRHFVLKVQILKK
ncbi:hypothetical protein C1646_669306 [Rhizophagus diaphanus]|nr:hypothetical protein C1646_669306 [Rhizophagus diaphanus] [Rhizophagus sp. MUCL 43196]